MRTRAQGRCCLKATALGARDVYKRQHPYNASGWDRDTVYPAMGFSEMYFLPDFDNAAKVRNYVSDQSDFEKIVEIYENKGDNPLFLFNVTMQNHSSYTESFDNFDPQIEVEGGSQTLNNYLSLLSLSDAALGELISYFEEQEEDTIIVFFGDHQTTNSVIEPILKQNGKSSSTLTEEEQADQMCIRDSDKGFLYNILYSVAVRNHTADISFDIVIFGTIELLEEFPVSLHLPVSSFL